MDTKTRKMEALELLTNAEMTGAQADRLTILTAQQVGYEVRKTRTIPNPDGDIDAYGLFLNGEHVAGDNAWESNLWAEVPDYANSVDACLTLPLPDGYFWLLESKFGKDPYGAILYKAFMKQETQKKYQSDASLPLAMLKAFWTLQLD